MLCFIIIIYNKKKKHFFHLFIQLVYTFDYYSYYCFAQKKVFYISSTIMIPYNIAYVGINTYLYRI